MEQQACDGPADLLTFVRAYGAARFAEGQWSDAVTEGQVRELRLVQARAGMLLQHIEHQLGVTP